MQPVINKVAKSWTGDESIKIRRLGVDELIVALPEFGKIVWMGEGWRGQAVSPPETDEFIRHISLNLLFSPTRRKYTAFRTLAFSCVQFAENSTRLSLPKQIVYLLPQRNNFLL
jgi:hypothetical protein